MNNKYTYIIGKGGGSSEGSLRYDQPQELTTEQKKQAQENLGIDLSANLKREIVEALPATGEANIIYMVSRAEAEEQNVYDEYMYINNAWEKIGSTEVDLSDYYTKEETDELINSKSRFKIIIDDMKSIVVPRSCTAKELYEAAYDGRDIVVYDDFEVTTYYYDGLEYGKSEVFPDCNVYRFFNDSGLAYIATKYMFETDEYVYVGALVEEKEKTEGRKTFYLDIMNTTSYDSKMQAAEIAQYAIENQTTDFVVIGLNGQDNTLTSTDISTNGINELTINFPWNSGREIITLTATSPTNIDIRRDGVTYATLQDIEDINNILERI